LESTLSKFIGKDSIARNSGWAIVLMYGSSEVDGISVFVSAAHAQTDPAASSRLMDEAIVPSPRMLS